MSSTFTLIAGLALVVALSASPHVVAGESNGGVRPKTGSGPPPAAAPWEFWDVWLRFHEAELCQGLDTVFVFRKDGMEIWCRIEDEKAYQKLTEIIAPLRSRYLIDLYPTRPSAERKQSDGRNPPPSLWNNAELRAYLQDPYARNGSLDDPEVPRVPPSRRTEADLMFRQRIVLFADQTLDWDRRMNRYAADLPALVEAVLCPGIPNQLHTRAKAVSQAHARAVDKYVDKLAENLTQALPKSAKKGSGIPEKKPIVAGSSPEDVAGQVADATQNVSRRIYRFIHPTHFTVELPDLRQPNLLEALRGLRNLVSIFLHTVNE